MPHKKTISADFRYNTGPSRIPWAAVGEHINARDTVELVKFLCKPKEGHKIEYENAIKKVAKEIENLYRIGKPAGKLSLGQEVKKTEALACKILNVKYGALLTNATAGFEIGYQYANLGPGDEVIAPAITFIATIAYPLTIGAKVVLADVDPHTLNMDPRDVARKITSKTKVIIPVHLGGYPVDMDPIMQLARKHNLVVIEDAAHAFGGSYKNKMLGTIGHFGSFSFHEVKNVTSMGEGGLIVTNLPFGKYLMQARFLGLDMSRKITHWLYDVTALKGKYGYVAAGNHSVTEIQALGLFHQMKRLHKIISVRRKAAEYLNRRLVKESGIITPPLDSKTIRSTHHLYLLQINPDIVGADVQQLKRKLSERGVTQIPHFAPLYKFSIMKQLGYDTGAIEASCPVAEEAFQHRFTHLPLYKYSIDDLKYMADSVIESVRELKAGR